MIYSGVQTEKEAEKAKKLFEKAKSYTEKSVFSLRFKPDWDQASRYAKEAADIYRRCGDAYYVVYIECLTLAGTADEELGVFTHAGGKYEEIGNMYAKMDSKAKAIVAYRKAGSLYQQSALTNDSANQLDKAANMLTSAAKLCEAEDETYTLYKEACELLTQSDRAVNCEAVFSPAINYYLNKNELSRVLEFMHMQNQLFNTKQKMFGNEKSRNMTNECIIYFKLKEYAKARAFIDNEMAQSTVVSGQHLEAVNALFLAIGGKDKEALKSILKTHNCLKFLAPAIVKIISTLTIDEEAQKHAEPINTDIEEFMQEEIASADVEKAEEDLLADLM